MAEGICFLNCAVLTVLALWPVFWTPIFGVMALCLFGLTFALFREIENKRFPLWLVGMAIAGLCLICVRAGQTIWLVFDKVNWAVTTPHEVEHFFLGRVINDPGWLFYPFVLTIKSTTVDATSGNRWLHPTLETAERLSGKHPDISKQDSPFFWVSCFLRCVSR